MRWVAISGSWGHANSNLEAVRSLGKNALVAMSYEEVDQNSYYARNSAVIEMADSLFAFRVNRSPGTQDTIDKARAKGLKVDVKRYAIGEDNG